MIGDAVRVTVIGLRVRIAFFRLRYGYGQSGMPSAPTRIKAGEIEGDIWRKTESERERELARARKIKM